MSKKGESVAELFASVGLDISQLDADFVNADKTVQANLSKLRSDKNIVRLKMELETSKLGEAASQTDILKIREEALTQQMHLQQQAIALVNAEYQKSVQAKGENSYESQRLQANLLKEQKAYSDMTNQLQRTQSQQKQQSSKDFNSYFGGKNNNVNTGPMPDFSKMIPSASGSSGIGGIFTAIGDGIKGASSALLGFGVAIKALGKIKDLLKPAIDAIMQLSQEAMKAGENAYQLSQRMNITASEAGHLGNVLAMGNVDTETLYKTMAKLDKQLLSTGSESGNAAQMLSNLGVSLKDANGDLLPVNEQLNQLAVAYQRAAKAGQEEEFIVEVLGSRGQQLIPILREMKDIQEATSDIEPANVDPQEMHQLTIETKKLDLQFASLKKTIGAAFAPLLEEIIPAVASGIKKVHELIKAAENFGRSDEEIAAIKKNREEQAKAAKEKKDSEEDFTALTLANNKQMADDYDKWRKEQEKKDEEAAKATQAINDETFKLTHTTYQNQMLDLQRKVEDYRNKGVDEASITAMVEAQKAKAIEEYNNNTVAKINEVYNTELENRLANIEREKQAWRQKGVDEVTATQWAEKQKQDAVRNAALEAIKNDRKRLEQVRDAMKQQEVMTGTGVDVNGNKINFSFQNPNSMQGLAKQWIEEERSKLGIGPNDTFSPELINAYQQMNNLTKNNLIPGLEANPGLAKTGTTISAPITIQIDNPVVTDTAGISQLADKVADVIQPAIQQAIGGGGNGY